MVVIVDDLLNTSYKMKTYDFVPDTIRQTSNLRHPLIISMMLQELETHPLQLIAGTTQVPNLF
jgi:hypothetical protein